MGHTPFFFESWYNVERTVTLSIVGYAALFTMLRLSGKRTLSKLNVFDFVFVVAVGSVFASMIVSKDVTLVEGVVQETNFDTYQVLRMDEAPIVETHIVASNSKPSGMGEPGTPPIAPAVANALLSLTGKATSSLPLIT
jgi:hypothetical protein